MNESLVEQGVRLKLRKQQQTFGCHLKKMEELKNIKMLFFSSGWGMQYIISLPAGMYFKGDLDINFFILKTELMRGKIIVNKCLSFPWE